MNPANENHETVLNRSFRADSFASGRKVVATAGTAEALSSTATPFGVLWITAETDNTGIVTVGGSDVVGALATRKGIPLAAGDTIIISCSSKLSKIYLDSTVNGDGVTYFYSELPA